MGRPKALAKSPRVDTDVKAKPGPLRDINIYKPPKQYILTVKGMKLARIKHWLQFNIVVPGLTLAVGNNSTDEPTCHAPACHSSPNPIDGGWCDIVILSLGLVAIVGLVLLWQFIRRRSALKRQLKKGIITKDEYEKLK